MTKRSRHATVGDESGWLDSKAFETHPAPMTATTGVEPSLYVFVNPMGGAIG